MQDEAQIRALEVGIQSLQAGDHLEQILELYPQWSDSLGKPLEAAQVLRIYAQNLAPTGEELVASRREIQVAAEQIWTRPTLSANLRANRTGILLLFSMLALAIGLISLFKLTETSLPGQPLYTFKELAWQTRFLIVQKSDRRLELEQAYDRERLEETRSLRSLGQNQAVTFAGLLTQEQPGSWKIAEIPAIISSQTAIIGNVEPQTWIEVDGIIRPDGVIEALEIRPREYTIVGTLQKITPFELVVDRIALLVDEDTIVHDSPMANSQVRIFARQEADGKLRVRLMESYEKP